MIYVDVCNALSFSSYWGFGPVPVLSLLRGSGWRRGAGRGLGWDAGGGGGADGDGKGEAGWAAGVMGDGKRGREGAVRDGEGAGGVTTIAQEQRRRRGERRRQRAPQSTMRWAAHITQSRRTRRRGCANPPTLWAQASRIHAALLACGIGECWEVGLLGSGVDVGE